MLCDPFVSVVFVSVSVCRKSVFYLNRWKNRAGFRHRGFLRPILYHVARKFFPLELCPNFSSERRPRNVLSKMDAACDKLKLNRRRSN